MRVTPEEARKALTTVQEVAGQTKRSLGGSGYFLLFWGVAWLGGLLAAQYAPGDTLPWIWIPLIALAWAASAWLGIRMGRRHRTTLDARIGGFYGLLACYAVLWLMLIQPISSRLLILLVMTLTLFGGAVIGVLQRLPQTIVGCVAATALTVAGYYVAPAYFWLWSAFSFGGFMTVVGVILIVREKISWAKN